jgi:hypothetical protein
MDLNSEIRVTECENFGHRQGSIESERGHFMGKKRYSGPQWLPGAGLSIMGALCSIAAVATTLILVSSGAVAKENFGSAYTRHVYEQCVHTSDDDPIMERRCTGHGGIEVHWINEPDNSSVSFGSEGAIGGEYDPRFTFAVVGNVIEWRGPLTGGSIAPIAAIVRYELCRAIGGPCTPELVIYRLVGKRASCIAATVNGRRPDANSRARAITDTFVASFDCEKDEPRAPE